MATRRTAVLWTGPPPVDDAFGRMLRRRGLTLEVRSDPEDVDFRTACAIVFNADGRSAGSLHDILDRYADRALMHGLTVVIRLESTNHPLLQARYPQSSRRWVFFDPTKRDDEDVAELVRRDPPGPAETDGFVVPSLSPPLLPEDELLLRRAFADCNHLVLKEMTEGKSSARVLRAHARRAGGDPPGFLLPFLVKIDAVDRIAEEIDRYNRFVAGHIPFTQRPNLDPARCVTGATRALMVSDFVEDAIPLSKLCDRPEGRRIIYSLFDDGLRSWRRHAHAEPPSPELPITDHLGALIQTAAFGPEMLQKAQRLGLRHTADEVVEDLKAHSVHPWKLGTIHGDLHPGNVMVRGAEAILIDFASIWDEKKPLVADLACLEVAMCFTVAAEHCVRPRGGTDRAVFSAWRRKIDGLFSAVALQHIPPEQTPDDFSWLADACRQTRGMAAQVGAAPAAYAAALAVYLLRRARLGGGAGANPSVEAYALVVAGRIVALLKSGML